MVAFEAKNRSFFCQTKRILLAVLYALVKKMGEVWQKISLIGADSAPPNQLL